MVLAIIACLLSLGSVGSNISELTREPSPFLDNPQLHLPVNGTQGSIMEMQRNMTRDLYRRYEYDEHVSIDSLEKSYHLARKKILICNR